MPDDAAAPVRSVTIPLLDPDGPAYSRIVVKVGDDLYLIIGMDRARGLLLLEKLPPDPKPEVPVPGRRHWREDRA